MTRNGKLHHPDDRDYATALTEVCDTVRAIEYLVQACSVLTDTEGAVIHRDATLILQAAKELRLRLVKEIADRARKPAEAAF